MARGYDCEDRKKTYQVFLKQSELLAGDFLDNINQFGGCPPMLFITRRRGEENETVPIPLGLLLEQGVDGERTIAARIDSVPDKVLLVQLMESTLEAVDLSRDEALENASWDQLNNKEFMLAVAVGEDPLPAKVWQPHWAPYRLIHQLRQHCELEDEPYFFCPSDTQLLVDKARECPQLGEDEAFIQELKNMYLSPPDLTHLVTMLFILYENDQICYRRLLVAEIRRDAKGWIMSDLLEMQDYLKTRTNSSLS